MRKLLIGGMLVLIGAMALSDPSFAEATVSDLADETNEAIKAVSDVSKSGISFLIAVVMPLVLLVGGVLAGAIYGKKKTENDRQTNPMWTILMWTLGGFTGGAFLYAFIGTLTDAVGFPFWKIVMDFWGG